MRYLTLCVAVGLILAVSMPAGATSYDIEKEINLYGKLDQHLVPDWGLVACAPTSAVNSFVYLQNKYPDVYDNSLVPDTNGNGLDNADMIAVVQILGGATYMNTVANKGTYSDDFIYGKMKYIEEKVPGWTLYEAQMPWAWQRPPIPEPDWVQTIYPTWEFIYGELVACEDVEIFITHSDGGHALTLTSFHWNDVDNDGVIDQVEGATIDYIDPWTGAWGLTNIWQSGLGSLIETAYFGATVSTITLAVSESPVPEPLTMLAVFTGIAGLGGYIRKRRMA